MKNNRPNIICILTDDQGAWAMGCAGNEEIITPNLDKLAESGIRFENFFCTSPVCSPARASLLTGRIPSQTGVHDWIKEGNGGDNAVEYLLDQPAYTDFLADNGYKCGISGKWHLGNSMKPQKSFSHWYVHERGSSHYHYAPMIKDGKLVNEPEYVTDLITDDALDFIDNNYNNEKPFYLSVHYTAPHKPWINEHPEKYTKLYKDCSFKSCPQEKHHPNAANLYSKEDAIKCLEGYFSSVTAMDNNVGRIINKLNKLGIRENTLVFFLSDNGFNCGHHGIWGKGNGTLPVNMYDTSIKIPAIFSLPGSIPKGVISDALLSGYDLMPTILEYVGTENINAKKLPGKSFMSLLTGKKQEDREHIVVYDEYGPVRMIRTKKWKYILRYDSNTPDELYDLTNDPIEEINLIDEKNKRKITEEMKNRLENWFSIYVDTKYDGSKLPVIGSGQINIATKEPAFEKERKITTNPHYDPGFDYTK